MSRRTRSKYQETAIEVQTSIFQNQQEHEASLTSGSKINRLFNHAVSQFQHVKLVSDQQSSAYPSKLNRDGRHHRSGRASRNDGNSHRNGTHRGGSGSGGSSRDSGNSLLAIGPGSGNSGQNKSPVISYTLQLFIDDIGYKFFAKLSKDNFITDSSNIVVKLIPKLATHLKDLKEKIINTLNTNAENEDETNGKKTGRSNSTSGGSSTSSNTANENSRQLRSYSLILPFNNGVSWSLLWVKFSYSSEYVKVYQVDSTSARLSGLNYNLKYLTKLLVCYLLDFDDIDDLSVNFEYVRPIIQDETLTDEDLVLYNSIKIIKGYLDHGFNYDITKDKWNYDEIVKYLKELKSSYDETVSFDEDIFMLDDQPSLSELGAHEVNVLKPVQPSKKYPTSTNSSTTSSRELRSQQRQKRKRNDSITDPERTQEYVQVNDSAGGILIHYSQFNRTSQTSTVRKRLDAVAESRRKKSTTSVVEPQRSVAPVDSPAESPSSTKPSTKSSTPTKSNNKKKEPPQAQLIVLSTNQSGQSGPTASGLSEANVVTWENLQLTKDQLKDEKPFIVSIANKYKDTYDSIQTRFYSRWAGGTHQTPGGTETASKAQTPSKPTGGVGSQDEFEFPMYGPTQIEYEILVVPEVVATKSLMAKLKRLRIFPTQQQMRSISNARRWINQRFKYDRANKSVIYLRDPDVIIPDYDDVPYIVMATHLHYNCLTDVFTYNIVRKNWYISKRSIEFILESCPKCGGDKEKQS